MHDPKPDGPGLDELLRVVSEEESFQKSATRLGLDAELVRALVRSAGRALTPPKAPKPPEKKADPAASTGETHVIAFCDGASKGNPGPAGAGAVLKTSAGRTLDRAAKYVGIQTNNVAEYEGLILAFERAKELGARTVEVRADSMLVVMQMKGEWKLKHPGLKPLWARAQALAKGFDGVSYKHIPRELNGDADEMSNVAIDEKR